MSENHQQLAVLLITGITFFLLVVSPLIRRMRHKDSSSCGCGSSCASKPNLPPSRSS